MEDKLSVADKTEYVDMRMVDINGVVATLKIIGAGSKVILDDNDDGDHFIIAREDSTIVFGKGIVYFKAGFNSVLLFDDDAITIDNGNLVDQWIIANWKSSIYELCSRDKIHWIENRISWFCREINTNVTGR